MSNSLAESDPVTYSITELILQSAVYNTAAFSWNFHTYAKHQFASPFPDPVDSLQYCTLHNNYTGQSGTMMAGNSNETPKTTVPL